MSKQSGLRWARRVEQEKIRRLYALDAMGIQHEELIDEVGYAIYARCESIRNVTEAHMGRAQCPKCASILEHGWKKNDLLICTCGWQLAWGDYLASYQRKQLVGGSGFRNFLEFLERWPQARTPRDKLLAIDWLLHQCHSTVKFPLGRPIAVNLIEGNAHEVAALLDDLAYGSHSTAGLQEARDAWRSGVGSPWLRRR